MKYIGALVDMCIAKGYITQDQAPWLYYGIEKRVTTILISIPMLIIGSLVSTPAMSIAFYISFCSLRTRTNGFQGCTDDCEEKIWAGKTEAEGWQGGCWWKIGYTARGNSLW